MIVYTNLWAIKKQNNSTIYKFISNENDTEYIQGRI